MGIYRGGDIARGLWALFRYSPRQGGQWHFRYRDHRSFPRCLMLLFAIGMKIMSVPKKNQPEEPEPSSPEDEEPPVRQQRH